MTTTTAIMTTTIWTAMIMRTIRKENDDVNDNDHKYYDNNDDTDEDNDYEDKNANVDDEAEDDTSDEQDE